MITRHLALLFLLATVSATAETRIRITGMQGRSEAEVLGLMGGRLAHVRSDVTSPSRADDAAFLVRQVLEKDGYSNVEVDWKVTGRSEILLTVKQGKRLSLGAVTVNGVPAAEATKLSKLYARPATKDRPIGSGDPPFREEDLEKGLGFIRQQLNAEGYWGAEVVSTGRATDPTGKVDLTIDVRPGALHRIAEPQIMSPDGSGVAQSRKAVRPFVGLEATTGNLNSMRAAVEESFVSQGYPDAKITVTRTLVSPRYIPGISIALGERYRLRRVRIEGLERTNPARIAARTRSLEGEWYDEAAMNKRLRAFLATGAFSSARVEKYEVSENVIDATLHFEEAPAKEVSFAAGVDSYQGFILRATYADRNLGGQMRGFSTGIELSARGVLGETKITDPWLFGTDVAATARAYALIYGREGYTSLETGLEGKTTWKLGDHYSLEALLGYSIVNLTEQGLPKEELGETLYTHPRIRITQAIDFRDSKVLPTKGWHLENPLEFGAATGSTTTTYMRTGLSGGWYHRINADYQLGLGGELAFVIPSGDGSDLPIDLRLFNGGSRSVRSFPERELGPSVDGYPTGGEGTWNTNFELVRKISGSLKAVGFLDAGSVSKEFEKLGSSEIELAVGLGLRLDLPIGPVRLEYGYNLTKGEDEPSGTIHFAIGVTF